MSTKFCQFFTTLPRASVRQDLYPRARIFPKVLKLTHFWCHMYDLNFLPCLFTQCNSILYSLPNVDVHPCLTPPPPYVRLCPFSLDPLPPPCGLLLWMTPYLLCNMYYECCHSWYTKRKGALKLSANCAESLYPLYLHNPFSALHLRLNKRKK